MARTTILAERTITDFFFQEIYELYAQEIFPAPFELVVGESYTVVWNDVTYICAGMDVSALMGPSAVAIGNGSNFGLSGNDEPFIILTANAGSDLSAVFGSFEDRTENKVAIYQEDANAIVLKDRDGNDVAYEGVTNIHVMDSDGEYRSFTEGEALSDVEISLDLSEGNQTITAPDGYLVKSAIIKKPSTLIPSNIAKGVDIAGVEGSLNTKVEEETSVALDFSNGNMVVMPDEGKAFSSIEIQQPNTLIPENIAEGINIAGIIGALAVGGGGGNIVIASGTFTGNGNMVQLTHNLGVLPDIFIAYSTAYKLTNSGSYSPVFLGFSSAFLDKVGMPYGQYSCYYSSGMKRDSASNGIESTSATRVLHRATATAIRIGSTYLGTSSDEYAWTAIGGLT